MSTMVWVRIVERSSCSEHTSYSLLEVDESNTLAMQIEERSERIREHAYHDHNFRGCTIEAVAPEEVPVDRRQRKLRHVIERKQTLIDELATYDQHISVVRAVCDLTATYAFPTTMQITRVYAKSDADRDVGTFNIEKLKERFDGDLDKIRQAVNSFLYVTNGFDPVRIHFKDDVAMSGNEYWSEDLEKYLSLNK